MSGKKVFFAFLLALISLSNFIYGDQFIIGNPASITNGLIPVNRFHNYSTYEMLYTSGEIGSECLINKIAFYKNNGSTSVLISNVSIYMKTSSATSLPSATIAPPYSEYTLVYSGYFPNNFGTSGWAEITLANPYLYNANGNLHILIVKGFENWSANKPNYTYTATGNTYLCRGGYADDSQPENLTQNYNRPVTLFDIEFLVQNEPPLPAINPNPDNGGNNVLNNVSLHWYSGGGCPSGYDVYFGKNPNPPKVQTLQKEAYYNPGILDYGNTYYWKIDPHNVYGYASDKYPIEEWSFTVMDDPTLTRDDFPYLQTFDNDWYGNPPAPLGWYVVNANHDGYTWRQTNECNIPAHSDPFAAQGMGNINDYLISPPLDLTNVNVQIKWFDMVENASYTNSYKVLLSYTDSEISSFTQELGFFSCNNTDWTEHSLDLSAYRDHTIYLAFYQYESVATNWSFGIDDFQIHILPDIPILSYNPAEIIFPFTAVGSVTDYVNVTITNIGDGTLNLTADNFSLLGDNNDFEVDYSNLDAHLETDQSVHIPIRFYPHSTGDKNAIFRISYGLRAQYDVILRGSTYLAGLLLEDFEENVLPAGWTKIIHSNNDILPDSDYNHTFNGQYSLKFSAYGESEDYNRYLFSPPILVSAFHHNLSFWSFTNNSEMLEWGIANDMNPQNYNWNPVPANNSSWQKTNLDLTDYTDQIIYLGFHYCGNSSQSVYLDDVHISCDIPANYPTEIQGITLTSNIPLNINNTVTANHPQVMALPNYINLIEPIVIGLAGSGSGNLSIKLGSGYWYCLIFYNGQWHYGSSYPCSVEAGNTGTITMSNVEFGSKDGVILLITEGVDPTLPVTLSRFTAVVNSDNFVIISWIAESETNHSGYNILRGENKELPNAITVNGSIIDNGSAAGTQISYKYIDFEVYTNMVYFYWLESVALDGSSEFFGPITVTIGDPAQTPLPPTVPMTTKLYNAFPNPFNPNTNIRYSLKETGKVTIEIYNLKGQKIKTFNQNHNSPGYYQVSWDGCDENGRNVASGIYFYRLNTGKYSSTKKMVLTK
ncbi:MAG TPA: choice-of-anchor J domain-containing protein [Candidatus Cloacimonas sp.]|nr:choice-of-anchor J domain-containing protein [Candidatus Cloacimonas sp.]HPS61092.1 choice-of-anchor J domain-containing protein [Candidatus Cloacimonas sp.]